MTRFVPRLTAICAVALAAGFYTSPAWASFESCVKSIRADVLKAGIKPEIVNAAFKGIAFDEKAVRFSRTQPEYRLAIWDYMAFLFDDARLADGAKMIRAHDK